MPPKKRTLSALSGNIARPEADSTSKAKRPARRLPHPTTMLGASMPPEIWSIIGEKLLDANATTALKSLSRVCKSFSSMFLPLLYSRRIIQLERFANSLGNESVPPGLECVKDYQVNISEFCRSGYYDPLENEDYSRLIIAHLNAMRRIRSFSWIDVSCEFTWGLNNILAHDDLLRILKSSTTLKSLMIQFAPQFIEDRIDLAQNSCFLPLKGFKNLTSLELYDFTGEKERLTKDIADVLHQNPGLKTLGLGIACDVDDSDEGIVLEYPADFFESLCSAYVSSKGRPLALETLRLGHGMCLHPPYDQEDLTDRHPDDHYVHGLLEVKSLKTLQVYNGLTVDSELDEDIFPDLDWSPFSVKRASLHRISVTMLDCETADWLSTSGNSVRELIVSNDYRIGDPDIDNFATLTNNLTMLYTKERCGSRFTDDDLSLSVLDRLQDCGENLHKLSLSLDFETQWERFSSHLTKMAHLTELRLSARTFRPYDGQYPHPSSSLWPGIKECEELAQRYIRLMSTLCPSLQYVMIGHRAWQICRPNEALMRYPTRRRLACELRRLPFDEIRGIELFALTPAPEHTGLIRPTLERDELEIMDTPMPPALLEMLRWNHMYDF